MQAKYEYYESNDGWRWAKVGGNGEITSSGEAHTTKGGCIAAIGRDMDDSSGYDIVARPADLGVDGVGGTANIDPGKLY